MTDHLLLDHAASTPVRPEASAALLEALARAGGGNPNAGHAVGRAARTVLEEARERLAAALDRSPHEVLFTAGGAEADQLAVVGLARAAAERGHRHIVCAAVDHPAVRDAVAWLCAHEGHEVTWLAPGSPRPLTADDVAASLRDDTGLLALTAADGELGIRTAADAATPALEAAIAVHRDAVQAIATGAPPAQGALAISGHKLGVPAGIGAALLPREVPVRPIVGGPGQERGLRSGTQPVGLAFALAVGVELAVEERAEHATRCAGLTTLLAEKLAPLEGVRPTVSLDAPHRLPTHLHLQVDRVDGEALAAALDAVGVAVSSGTACATGSVTRSAVLAACGVEADAVLRCSVGRTTTEAEVVEAAARIGETISQLRAGGGGFL